MTMNREPKGVPTGGQFAAGVHPETDVTLDDGLVPVRTGDDNNFVWRLPNGKKHCVGGPARQTDGGVAAGGGEAWFLNGQKHRVNGPAVQWGGGVAVGGGESWWLEGKRHRVDGPAVQRYGGVAAGGSEEYWLDGVRVPADQYEFLVACRSDTHRMAAPTERPSDGPQTFGGPVRPGV